MRCLYALAFAGALCFSASSANVQDTTVGPTVNPATPSDPVIHHHKAYPKTSYGVSCPGDRVVWVNTNSGCQTALNICSDSNSVHAVRLSGMAGEGFICDACHSRQCRLLVW